MTDFNETAEQFEVKREISQQVDTYKAAEDKLLIIAAIENIVDEEFTEDLALVEIIQNRLAKRLNDLLAQHGVDQTSKEYEAVQKNVRKKLFPPMILAVDNKYEEVSGKTYKQEAFAVTLVEQKPQLVPNPTLSEIEYYKAHKEDVEQLIAAGLYNLISIPSDDATIAFVDARVKSGNPLQSVVLQRSGYCKVNLIYNKRKDEE